jgi:hypothetical protein
MSRERNPAIPHQWGGERAAFEEKDVPELGLLLGKRMLCGRCFVPGNSAPCSFNPQLKLDTRPITGMMTPNDCEFIDN